MKKIILAIVVFFATLGITRVANASALFEPYVGYGHGKMGSSKTYTLSGIYYGARLAYKDGNFFVGGEYQSGKMTWDTSPSKDTTGTDLGVVIGYEMSAGVRLYGNYFFDSKMKVESSGYEGTAIKVGVGFKVMQPLLMNVEYYMATYTKDKSGNSLGTDVNANIIMVNFSLPIEF